MLTKMIILVSFFNNIPEQMDKFKGIGIIIAIVITIALVTTYAVMLDCFWCGKKFPRPSRTRVDKGIKHFCCMGCFINYDNKVALYKGRDDHEEGEVKAHGKRGVF